MEFRWLRVERSDPGVVFVRMNKPPVNALGRELVAELSEIAEHLRTDADARCVVLGTAGKHFCAGADLKERKSMTPEEAEQLLEAVQEDPGDVNRKAAARGRKPKKKW